MMGLQKPWAYAFVPVFWLIYCLTFVANAVNVLLIRPIRWLFRW